MEREVGGGIGMGNTCKPMAVSFQCMTKSTTKKKKFLLRFSFSPIDYLYISYLVFNLFGDFPVIFLFMTSSLVPFWLKKSTV